MNKTIIVINAEIQEEGKIVPISPATETMVSSLKKAINSSKINTEICIMAAASLWSESLPPQPEETIYCPLTIELPESFVFPAQRIYQRCKNVVGLRQWVATELGYRIITEKSGYSDFWLPVIVTSKGFIYGEVIGEGVIPYSCEQPVDLPDQLRQPLYQLAYQLLSNLDAPSAVYLLQFSLQDGEIIFNRLWPFPAAPALASLRVQEPDLYTCHWYCLTNQPIPEIIVKLLQ
ncbi:MAG: hypothetical protein EA365_10285 [Gloeocapsa sp. DLM2.Bin57]|nr:MAG: hypothetical protein EA365_10285 [Gloeocapsa sp. DLM2.Bin57]